MSVQLMESITAAGFGAAEQLIDSKVKQTLPGGIPMGVGLEVGGILFGLFGQKFGASASLRDPIMISALALAGARAVRLQQAGKLFQPSQWAAVGGGGDGSYGGDPYSNAAAGGLSSRAPGVRRLGRGGQGMDIYGGYAETGGVAS